MIIINLGFIPGAQRAADEACRFLGQHPEVSRVETISPHSNLTTQWRRGTFAPVAAESCTVTEWKSGALPVAEFDPDWHPL